VIKANLDLLARQINTITIDDGTKIRFLPAIKSYINCWEYTSTLY
jgi:hypothetical protein